MLLQDSSLNPGTGDKVTFHIATHIATARAAEKAGAPNSKYAGLLCNALQRPLDTQELLSSTVSQCCIACQRKQLPRLNAYMRILVLFVTRSDGT